MLREDIRVGGLCHGRLTDWAILASLDQAGPKNQNAGNSATHQLLDVRNEQRGSGVRHPAPASWADGAERLSPRLSNEQDREDVFQATFLLLARKAGSIRKRQSVGSWLHGVAHRLAVRCRIQDNRRRVYERQVPMQREATSQASEAWEELQTLLDEAIAELPEKYRSALVLCYLEDHTHEEAARRLGCRLTTFRSRVARQRTSAPCAGPPRPDAFMGVSSRGGGDEPADAALPALLRNRTLTVAMQFAKGQAVSMLVSASTIALVEGGLQAMSSAKLKSILALLLMTGLMFGGASLLAHQIRGAKIPRISCNLTSNKPLFQRTKQTENRRGSFRRSAAGHAVARLGTVRSAWVGWRVLVPWSPDGKTLAAGSANQGNDNTLCLFDAATGKPIRRLCGSPPPRVNRLASSPDVRLPLSSATAARLGASPALLFRRMAGPWPPAATLAPASGIWLREKCCGSLEP